MLLYAPGYTGKGEELEHDPVKQALETVGIFGGAFVAPNLLEGVNPNEYALYVTSKPFW